MTRLPFTAIPVYGRGDPSSPPLPLILDSLTVDGMAGGCHLGTCPALQLGEPRPSVCGMKNVVDDTLLPRVAARHFSWVSSLAGQVPRLLSTRSCLDGGVPWGSPEGPLKKNP